MYVDTFNDTLKKKETKNKTFGVYFIIIISVIFLSITPMFMIFK